MQELKFQIENNTIETNYEKPSIKHLKKIISTKLLNAIKFTTQSFSFNDKDKCVLERESLAENKGIYKFISKFSVSNNKVEKSGSQRSSNISNKRNSNVSNNSKKSNIS